MNAVRGNAARLALDLALAAAVLSGGPSVAARAGELPDAPAAASHLAIARDLTAHPGDSVSAPLRFAANGNLVSSVVFSIDFDERLLVLDPSDADMNGTPDAVTFNLPRGLRGSAIFNASDTDGEIDVLIFDSIPPLAALESGTIMTMTFQVNPTATSAMTDLLFAADPPPSMGDTGGQAVAVTAESGLIRIVAPTAQVTPGPSPTPTATPMTTVTVTSIPSVTPSPTVTSTPGGTSSTATPGVSPTATVLPSATGTTATSTPVTRVPPTLSPVPTRTPTLEPTQTVLRYHLALPKLFNRWGP